ncbi:uncharacterized protein LOC128240317 isoform X2 [Mya arenaria]|uniref:uncharacterized protein LOC128240317 isoform X2 n=1 Tax=Mya arenaria TaxID=6604 RepID=UPI0022E721DF|nr:uncharacterized protein LOC128240317 isoform X2 [Mya arenaria]
MIILLLESLWILKEVMTYFGIRRFIDLPDVSSDEDDGLVFVKHGTIETSVILINSDEAGEDVVVISDDVVNTGGQKQKEKDVFIDLSDKDDTDSIKKETTEVFYATRISNTESANINSSIITDGAASNVVTPKDVIIINDDDDNETVGLPSTEPQPSTSNEKELDVTAVHGYERFPFLNDPRTVEFIRRSNTIFLMRGLSGSGKSTVVRCLQQLYPSSVVCSADSYFMDAQGNYCWDQNKLSDAHQYCQTLATQTCDQKCPVVIIDNTNIQRWTMAHYVKLAQTSHYYHIIIVEPETPWRYDPDILAARNSHGVTKDIIAKKLQSLRDNKCLPYYYGWFISQPGSQRLVTMLMDTLGQCVAELGQTGSMSGIRDLLTDMLNRYNESYTEPRKMLHCTANYLGNNAQDPYHKCNNVVTSLGKAFAITISGFVFSRRAICARVDLYWENDEITAVGQDGGNKANFETASSSKKQNTGGLVKHNNSEVPGEVNQNDKDIDDMLNLFVKPEEEDLRSKYEGQKRGVGYNDRQRLLKHGCSAHVTISYAKTGQARHSGDDVLRIVEMDFNGQNIGTAETSIGKVVGYGGEMCAVTLKRPVTLDSLFQGFYSMRR